MKLDIDEGFTEGRQYGRGRSGGQVRDEVRTDFDYGRGTIFTRILMQMRKKYKHVVLLKECLASTKHLLSYYICIESNSDYSITISMLLGGWGKSATVREDPETMDERVDEVPVETSAPVKKQDVRWPNILSGS